MAGAHLHHEEHIQPAQGHRAVHLEKSQASMVEACAGTAATWCGCGGARTGSAAASVPAAP
jgi:hypothetical protein